MELQTCFSMGHIGRAEGYLSPYGIGDSEQAAHQLFLQDIDCE